MTQTPPEPQHPAEPQLPPPPGYDQPPAYIAPAGYAQPPAYGPPAGYAMPTQMQYAPAPDSRNVLGILALIAPFVGLSLAGIVLGHLGLGAVKKGTANNKGIALAGTIVSWVFTVFVVVGIVAAIAIPVFLNQRAQTNEAAVRMSLLDVELELWNQYGATGEIPEVTFDNGDFSVAGTVIPADSSIYDGRLVVLGADTFCIEAHYNMDQVLSVNDASEFGDGC